MVEGVKAAVTGTNAVIETFLIHLHSPDHTPNIVSELILVRIVVEGVDVEGLVVGPIGQLGEVAGDAEPLDGTLGSGNGGVGDIDGPIEGVE